MANRFLVVARPRSRTSWLATFLNAGGATCLHDIVDLCHGPEAYAKALDSSPSPSGAVDTGAVLVLSQILAVISDCAVAVIDRPRAECEAEMARIGHPMDMAVYDGPMEAVKASGALVVPYGALDSEEAIRALWHHLVGSDFPRQLYEHCRWMHIEPSKGFFDTEYVRRQNDPAILNGWTFDHLK